MTGAIRRGLAEDRSEFDPRKALMAAKKAACSAIKTCFEAFGCAGQADRGLPRSLDAMVSRYN